MASCAALRILKQSSSDHSKWKNTVSKWWSGTASNILSCSLYCIRLILNIKWKSVHTFAHNIANRQTNCDENSTFAIDRGNKTVPRNPYTVEFRYNAVQYHWMLYKWLQELKQNSNPSAGYTKDIPYLALTGELWGAFCDFCEKIDPVITAPHYTGKSTFQYSDTPMWIPLTLLSEMSTMAWYTPNQHG